MRLPERVLAAGTVASEKSISRVVATLVPPLPWLWRIFYKSRVGSGAASVHGILVVFSAYCVQDATCTVRTGLAQIWREYIYMQF